LKFIRGQIRRGGICPPPLFDFSRGICPLCPNAVYAFATAYYNIAVLCI